MKLAEFRLLKCLQLILFGLGSAAIAAPQVKLGREGECQAELKRDGDRYQLRYKLGNNSWATLFDNSPHPQPLSRKMDGFELPILSYELHIIPQGTSLYHWGDDEETTTQWPQQKRVTEAQLKRRLTYTKNNAGGGVYVSLNPFDSSDYGAHVVVFTAPQDLLVLAHNGGRLPNCLNSALAQVGVMAWWYRATWINLINLKALSMARAGNSTDVCRFLQSSPKFLPASWWNYPSDFINQLLWNDQKYDYVLCPGIKGPPEILNRVLRGQALSEEDRQALSYAVEMFANSPLDGKTLHRTALWDEIFKIIDNPEAKHKFEQFSGTPVPVEPAHTVTQPR